MLTATINIYYSAEEQVKMSAIDWQEKSGVWPWGAVSSPGWSVTPVNTSSVLSPFCFPKSMSVLSLSRNEVGGVNNMLAPPTHLSPTIRVLALSRLVLKVERV